jgi:hypothetical protein
LQGGAPDMHLAACQLELGGRQGPD